MKKSPVAGVAGAVRILELTLGDLTGAENHGKRLDKVGPLRAINHAPPLTTTGLDVVTLYHAHVEGALVPKARAKALQILIQFPKDLVDGDDAKTMLHHAREFAKKVFGDQAIFADRVDRDEEANTSSTCSWRRNT